MTSRERIATALAHREPDHTPVFEYVMQSPVADQLLGRNHAADPANRRTDLELSFGAPEDVRRHTLECLEAGRGEGGHILRASNAITASVPLVNCLAVVQGPQGPVRPAETVVGREMTGPPSASVSAT